MFARSGEAGRRRPRIIIAHSNPAFTSAVERAFRRHGWVVAQAADGAEARRLTEVPADLIVLDTELAEESGWLTCAKLTLRRTREAVVLVADELSEGDADFAAFSGAVRLMSRAEGVAPLLEEAGLSVPVKQVV
jgi:DNA-binding response OmpR family regulator